MTPPERLRTRRLSRRTFLRGAAASASVAGLAATAPAPVAAQSQFGGWLTSDANGGVAKNFDGTVVDKTGKSEVTVEVGAEGNGGTFAFTPPAMRVSPGTTVTFEWVSDTHNIFIQSQPEGANWQGHESIENTGFTHSHTFEATGVYKYYCQPHLPMGMKGAIVVEGASGGQSAGVPAEYGQWFTGDGRGGETKNFDGTTVDETGQSEVTVEVGAEGNGGTFAFAPPAVRVSPGTTVTFEWVSDTHNIFVEGQPEGANWQGHESIENQGFTHSHTFETTGVYKYYCQPHLPMGMKGAIVVGPAPGSGGDGGSVASTGGPPVGDQRPGVVSVWEGLFAGSVLLGLLAPVASGLLRRESASVQRE